MRPRQNLPLNVNKGSSNKDLKTQELFVKALGVKKVWVSTDKN
jgi:hypothetical protein